jgi:aspartyl-tRNA(Asn)/glutamyl-tRNA(Gln) amidotransferase subunit A
MISSTLQKSVPGTDFRVGVLTRDPHVLHAASRLKGKTVRIEEELDWGALRRAMLLQIEIEAAPMLLPLPGLSPALRAAMEFGRDASSDRRKKAETVMDAARKTITRWMDGGLLLLPSTPGPAFPFDGPVPADQADYATLSSLLGLPAISVPARVAPGDLPIGVQLVAPAGSDASLLAAAAVLDLPDG